MWHWWLPTDWTATCAALMKPYSAMRFILTGETSLPACSIIFCFLPDELVSMFVKRFLVHQDTMVVYIRIGFFLEDFGAGAYSEDVAARAFG